MGTISGKLQHIGNLCHLRNRLGKIFHILDKCLDIAYFYGSFYSKQATAYRHRHIPHVSERDFRENQQDAFGIL